MLMQRFLTMLVVIPFLAAVIFIGPIWFFKFIVFAFVFIGCLEWIKLTPIYRFVNQVLFFLIFMLTLWLSGYCLDCLVLLGIVNWFFIFFMILTYPQGQKYWDSRIYIGLLGLILLPLFYYSITYIYSYTNGRGMLFYILSLIWATDIGAYIAGKTLGEHKLIPNVSPGKTIEGTFGGFILAFIIAGLGYLYFKPINALLWFIVAFFLMIISMIGDLFISVLKRRVKIKDTGNIFPGHGGMLDRIDSLIAAVPLFYAALKFMPLGL